MEATWERWYQRKKRQKKESLSGAGSGLEQTESIREGLPRLLREIGARSLLDAPCGDLHWIHRVDLGLERYVGADIVDALIEENERRYAGPGRSFLKLDLTRDSLPKADVILCRDCLVHLSFADIRRVLANFKQSGATYLLTTCFAEPRENVDIPTGKWRTLNLERAPFLYPPPITRIQEDLSGGIADKCLALWLLADLPELSDYEA